MFFFFFSNYDPNKIGPKLISQSANIADTRISETEAWHISTSLIGPIKNARRQLDEF